MESGHNLAEAMAMEKRKMTRWGDDPLLPEAPARPLEKGSSFSVGYR